VTYDADLALMRLPDPVPFGSHINPICVVAADETYPPGTLSFASGWGNTDPDLTQHWGSLKYVAMYLWSNADCLEKTLYQRFAGL
jgi:transmembrane serine protease 9